MVRIQRYADKPSWIADILADFRQALAEARADGRQPLFCLAGGSTPAPAYRAMAADMARVNGKPVLLVIGDERLSPRAPSDLNETMIRSSFATALDSGAAWLVAWDARSGPDSALSSMEAALRPLAGRPFDAAYLGLGADGHTAGLFPGTPALAAPGLVALGLAPSEPRARASLTLPVLRGSRRLRFIVKADGKEEALERLARGDEDCPAALAARGRDAVAFVLD